MQAILKELEEHGVSSRSWPRTSAETCQRSTWSVSWRFDQPPLTRKERANNVRKRNYFTKYGDAARAVLEALLDKFANEDVDDIENIGVLKVQPLTTLGTPIESSKRIRHQRRLPQSRPRPRRRTVHRLLVSAEQAMAIGTTIKTIQDIMRKDAGVDGDAQRISQLVWMIFLKVFRRPRVPEGGA